MALVHRILYPEPIESLEGYLKARGGRGLDALADLGPSDVIAILDDAGLRGRGGAGFPTGRKWRTILDARAPHASSSVVVNGAEGEPGTFKDRTIFRNDPYQVIEGAVIAAHVVGADEIVFGLKAAFGPELARLRAAISEVTEAGWLDGLTVRVVEGPDEYLYGEETALLEVADGRYPFPRIAPPFRRGLHEEAADGGTPGDERETGLSADIEMVGAGEATPALVENVETLANVAHILARGASWYRTEGTDESPGTIVCTVTGAVERAGVGEVIMGTPLREVLEAIGGPPDSGRYKAVLVGVSNTVITEDQLDAPVSYEGLAAIGSGLGSAGFIVYDDAADMAGLAAGVASFLATESCGQCRPCKVDGLRIAELLEGVAASQGEVRDLDEVRVRLGTVADGARCFLATQQQIAVGSLLDRFPDELTAHAEKRVAGVAPTLVAELRDISEAVAVWDERHRDKQPDWSYDAVWSGKAPVERFAQHYVGQELPEEPTD